MTAETEIPLVGGQMTIWEHIGELRTRLIRCVIAIVAGMAFGFWVYPYLLQAIEKKKSPGSAG